MSQHITSTWLAVSLSIILLLNACQSSSSGQVAEIKESNQQPMTTYGTDKSKQPHGQGQQEAAQQKQAEKGITTEQVKLLLQKEFGGLFKLDEQTLPPNYLVGDFNGDGEKDIVVAVRLNQHLDEASKAKPPFKLRKPILNQGGDVENSVDDYMFTMGDLAQYQNDLLLIIVQGSREQGWSNSRPSQKFVLIDAMYFGVKYMKLYRGEFKPARATDDVEISPPPHLIGDAVLVIVKDDTGTALYWDGKEYSLYPIEEIPK